MQPKGRVVYIQDQNGAFVPWEGSNAGFGGVTIYTAGGTAVDTPTGTADNITTAALLGTGAFNYGFDGTNWDRLRSFAGNADDIAAPTLGLLGQAAFNFAFDGTTYDRLRTGSAANISAATVAGALLTTQQGDWSVNHTPVANTQATITRAAGGAGVRHVCTSITFSLNALTTAAETTVLVNLRDGATGAGTILWSQRVHVIPGGTTGIALAPLNIFGTANTAMTLEFAAAGGADTFESVAMTGHDVV